MNLEEFIKKLSITIPLSSIIFDEQVKKNYEIDWRKSFKGTSLAVLFPSLVTEIQQIIILCNQYNVAIVPQGGNTSLCGAAVPATNISKPQIIVNLSKLNKILDINTTNKTILVESGCLLGNIKTKLLKQNLFFPLTLGSLDSCQIGGNIATNAGGINVLKYGMMRDLVLGIEVVLANGKIINNLNKLVKNNTYIDLKQLFIGSEGTLGIITKAYLRVYPCINNNQSGIVSLNNFKQVIELFEILASYSISAFEVINKETILLLNKYFIDYSLCSDNDWLVMFDLEIENDFDYSILLSKIRKITDAEIYLSYDENSKNKIWTARELIPLAEKKAGGIIKHDISLPIDQIENFVKNNRIKILNYYPNSKFIIFGHLGDGNLHYNIKIENFTTSIENNINDIVYQDVINLAGSYSAEHGVGLLKKKLYKTYSDQNSYNLCKDIKSMFDPNDIFNPGKIFD